VWHGTCLAGGKAAAEAASEPSGAIGAERQVFREEARRVLAAASNKCLPQAARRGGTAVPSKQRRRVLCSAWLGDMGGILVTALTN